MMKLYVVNSKQGPESAGRTTIFHSLGEALYQFGRLVERWETHLDERMLVDLGPAQFGRDLTARDMVLAWPERGAMARDYKVSIEVEYQHNYSS